MIAYQSKEMADALGIDISKLRGKERRIKMNFVLSSLSQKVLCSIVASGVYLTLRIYWIMRISAERAFPLRAAVVVSQIQAGANPWLATLLALLAGVVAGLVSGICTTPR